MIKNNKNQHEENYFILSRKLNQRLKSWANWRSKIIERGLGYSSSSIESKLRSCGVLKNSLSSLDLHINDEAEEIDSLINELDALKKEYAQAIRIRYLDSSNFQNKTTLKNNLRLAKLWLLARVYH